MFFLMKIEDLPSPHKGGKLKVSYRSSQQALLSLLSDEEFCVQNISTYCKETPANYSSNLASIIVVGGNNVSKETPLQEDCSCTGYIVMLY